MRSVSASSTKFFLLFVTFCFVIATAEAQNAETVSEIPDSTARATTKPEIEDATILAMLDGLMNTPLYENPDRMNNLTNMFIQWAIETDKISIELLRYFSKITETNKMLSIPFFCGWVKAAHENGWKKNDFPIDENIASVKSVIAYYRKNESKLLNDPYIIELEDKLKNDKLSEYLQAEINWGRAISDLINSDINDKNKKPLKGKDKTIFIADRKEVSKQDFEKLVPNDIDSLTVVKGEEDIKKHTNRDCETIIIVRLKKNK